MSKLLTKTGHESCINLTKGKRRKAKHRKRKERKDRKERKKGEREGGRMQ